MCAVPNSTVGGCSVSRWKYCLHPPRSETYLVCRSPLIQILYQVLKTNSQQELLFSLPPFLKSLASPGKTVSSKQPTTRRISIPSRRIRDFQHGAPASIIVCVGEPFLSPMSLLLPLCSSHLSQSFPALVFHHPVLRPKLPPKKSHPRTRNPLKKAIPIFALSLFLVRLPMSKTAPSTPTGP